MPRREFDRQKHHGQMTVRQAGERARQLIEEGKAKEREEKKEQEKK